MSGRPRLNVAPVPAPTTIPDRESFHETRAPSPERSRSVESRSTSAVGVAGPVGEQLRRSSGAKRNHTVSVPADLATALRQRANADGWSITDLVFLAVERHRARLVATPELPGREVGPRRAIARAHLVLYLAQDEWTAWQDSATTGGLRTPSRLVSEALANFV